MNTFSYMASAAAKFQDRLLMAPAVVRRSILPEPESGNDFIWCNLLLSSSLFWHGHVETFQIPGRLSILHVCVFPHLDDASPIFGFDMIAGPSKVTGIFLDLSKTTDCAPVISLRDTVDNFALDMFVERRSLPKWGRIFSPDMLAIRPTSPREIELAVLLGQQALDGLLSKSRIRSKALTSDICAGQHRYVDAQRQNEHTFKMLSSIIGKDRARCFIDEILFPPIPMWEFDGSQMHHAGTS